MTVERRLVMLLLVLGLIAVPAATLRAFCAGNSCDAGEERAGPAPFCSLDPRVRELVSAGFYEGRSPEALGVTAETPVASAIGGGFVVPWPASQPPRGYAAEVPLVFLGPGFRATELPSDLGLDQIAPTLEPLLGVERPFPDVRSGRAIESVVVPGAGAPLTLLLVWKGVGMPEIRGTDTPWLDGVGAITGPSEERPATGGLAEPGSLPYDPAAVLATIGSGGLPSDHGITGTVVRAEGGVARAFAPRAPSPVIAALGDDLDEATGGRALIGLLATDVSDRGLIGGTWYGNEDDDLIERGTRAPVARVKRLLDDGWGADTTPDLLGIVLEGSVTEMDRTTRRIVDAVQARVPAAAIVMTATGSLGTDSPAVVDAGSDLAPAVDATVAEETPLILAAGPGGLFPDEAAMLEAGVTTQQVADAMRAQTAPDGTPLFADTFPSFAVRFGRYC